MQDTRHTHKREEEAKEGNYLGKFIFNRVAYVFYLHLMPFSYTKTTKEDDENEKNIDRNLI